jgi:hypothetical protein
MAKNDSGPRVPDGPTAPGAGQGPETIEEAAGHAGSPAGGEGRPPKEDKRSGGRRSYEEILEEKGVLLEQNAELRVALDPFSRIPIDSGKPPGHVQYVLARGGKETKLTGEHIQRARTALGMP